MWKYAKRTQDYQDNMLVQIKYTFDWEWILDVVITPDDSNGNDLWMTSSTMEDHAAVCSLYQYDGQLGDDKYKLIYVRSYKNGYENDKLTEPTSYIVDIWKNGVKLDIDSYDVDVFAEEKWDTDEEEEDDE